MVHGMFSDSALVTLGNIIEFASTHSKYFLSSPWVHNEDDVHRGLVHARPPFVIRGRDIYDEKGRARLNDEAWDTPLPSSGSTKF
jgi:hypothetical protein